VAPAGRVSARRSGGARLFWSAYVALIFGYLYLCMFRGGPFIAFDHENYINFLNEPYPFFFEPGYTAVAFVVNALVDEDGRFPVVFLLFTAPPLAIVWRSAARGSDGGRAMMVFACIVTKAFYIGYITQRFLFAELWVAALLIARGPADARVRWTMLLPGMVHFSSLTAIPALLWLRSTFTVRKTVIAFALLSLITFYVRVVSGFQLLGYDYSRYLDADGEGGGFPVLSALEMGVLAMICRFVLPRDKAGNFVALIGLLLMMKVAFGDIEVFSRIFQVEIDVVMVMAGLHARRGLWLLFLFGFGFFVSQVAFTKTSAEMLVYHATAIVNVLSSF
jgi:hypothetical protein